MDYSPFGMIQPGRKYESGKDYRYSINGQEKEKEINENITSAEFWMYDSRVCRRWNVDPVFKKDESGYSVFANNPVWFRDIDGADTIKFNATKTIYSHQGKANTNSEIAIRPRLIINETFSIEVNEAQGDDVFIYNATMIIDGVSSTKSTILKPTGGGAAGVTMGKKIFFDGLWTSDRKNHDWESVGKFMNLDRRFYDYMINRYPQSRNWRSNALSIAAMEGILPVFTRSAMLSFLGYRYTGLTNAASNSVNTYSKEQYLKQLTPLDEFDVSKTLYRGTTGSETGATVIFLTDDAAVAATYIKKGGQVMQYEMSQFSLKSLEASGDLTLKTGIHGTAGTVSKEYMFTGKSLVEAINSIAKPLKK